MRYLLDAKNGFCYWDSDTKSGRYIDNDKISAFDIDEKLHYELVEKILKKGAVAKSYAILNSIQRNRL